MVTTKTFIPGETRTLQDIFAIFAGPNKSKFKDIYRKNDLLTVISRTFQASVLELVPSRTHKISHMP